MKKQFSNVNSDLERAFYGSKDASFENVLIAGPLDGESSFKESKNIDVLHGKFYLRYPFWHNDNLEINSSEFFETCRAPLWYDNSVRMNDVVINGVKAFRECTNIEVKNSKFVSEELFWNCHKINIENTTVTSVYGFFGSSDISLKNVGFAGKYSFQYVNNAEIIDSNLDTKDAFWHSKNVTVKNSVIKGEYLGWYSENLTLINCTITGTQPLCYAKNLALIDCTMEGCDLCFEYSEVNGNIVKDIKSIKNPLKGNLAVESVEEVIIDENDRSNGNFKLVKTK